MSFDAILDTAEPQVSKQARTRHLAELRNDDTIQITTRRPPVWRERPLASLSSALPSCASQRHELLFVSRIDHRVPSGQPQTPLSALPLGRMSAGSGSFLGQDGSASSPVYYRRCYRTLPRHCAMMRWPPMLLHFSVLLLRQLASYCRKRWLGVWPPRVGTIAKFRRRHIIYISYISYISYNVTSLQQVRPSNRKRSSSASAEHDE